MAATGERPLMLSETGMDTIREGEEHQAELLTWQARAAFELGLSGFIVFAFTDEWHTGGAEITDWAFGLVKQDRTPQARLRGGRRGFQKPASAAAASELPRRRSMVPAYNAAGDARRVPRIARRICNYPDYETIVVDDGSSDSTARDRRSVAGVRLIRARASRPRGRAQRAESRLPRRDASPSSTPTRAPIADWLYHLVEALTRRGAAAAGGPEFRAAIRLSADAAIAARAGTVRARFAPATTTLDAGVRMQHDRSTKRRPRRPAASTRSFTAAGDDVDFSWRLAERRKASRSQAPGRGRDS